MTACHAYYSFRDLQQTYALGDMPYVPTPPRRYDSTSVMGYLASHPDFSYFTYLLQIAEMDILANQSQFTSTLMVCPDNLLTQQLGDASFFMNLDRHQAVRLVNLHILPHRFRISTFQGEPLSLVTTRDPIAKVAISSSQQSVSVKASGNKSPTRVIGTETFPNGILYVLSEMLLTDNIAQDLAHQETKH